MRACDLSNAQLLELADGIDEVGWQQLELEDTRVDPETVARLLNKMPDLHTLYLTTTSQSSLRFEDFPKLRRATVGRDWAYPSVARVRLVNMPSLQIVLDISPYADYVHIESSPNVEGLTFHGLLPSYCVLKDLRALKFFGAGGSQVNDELFDTVFESREAMQKLSLPYSVVSQESLRRVGDMEALVYLNLTGCDLTDDVVLSWDLDRLRNLKYLRLDNTSITEAAVQHLSALDPLVLTFNGTPTKLTPDLIASLTSIERLGIGGCSVTPAIIEQMSKLENLKLIDFSDCTVTGDSALALAASRPPALRFVYFNGATVDSALLKELVRTGMVELLLENTNSDLELIDRLVATRRANKFESEASAAHYGLSVSKLEMYGDKQYVPESGNYYRGELNSERFSPTLGALAATRGFGREQASPVPFGSGDIDQLASPEVIDSLFASRPEYSDDMTYESMAYEDMVYDDMVYEETMPGFGQFGEPAPPFEILGQWLGRWYLTVWGVTSSDVPDVEFRY